MPSLVVVDAWIDTVVGGLPVKDPQKARQAVGPWKEYAAKSGAAILLVTHTNRQDSQDIRNNYGLSGALRQVARSTMYALEDPDTKALIVGPDKSNLGAKGVAHWFEKTPVRHFDPTADSDGTVALLESLWDDDRSIHDLISEQGDSARPARKTSAIDLWLKETLADGPVLSTELSEKASAEGYSEHQLRGARERLDVEAVRIGAKWGVSL